ncbi:MAG: adenylyl-sulfate kinase, partial [Gammaproteobacteria bacterium]|nr:adenylyl-sulfate kinase [Gammaproteobacteria bacterium]
PPLEVCKHRDPSGLYAASATTDSGNVPGVSFPYTEPEDPDLVLATDTLSIDDCIEKVIELLKERQII